MTMVPHNALDEFACKSDWEDKTYKALCAQCERVVHAGESEEHARRKGREHERKMNKYANAEECDNPEHALAMNPDQTEHKVAVRSDIY